MPAVVYSMSPSFLGRLSSFYKRHGFRETAGRGLDELHRLSFLGRMALYQCRLPVTETAKPPWLQVQRVGSTTLDDNDRKRIVDVWNPEVCARQIVARFQAGAELWLARAGGVLAGFGWSIRGLTMEPHFFPLSPDDVHLFDFFVFPEFRGRNINVALVWEILRMFGQEGAHRAHIECAMWNTPQIRSLSKTPFIKYAEASKLCLGGRPVVCWWRPSVLDSPYRSQSPVC